MSDEIFKIALAEEMAAFKGRRIEQMKAIKIQIEAKTARLDELQRELDNAEAICAAIVKGKLEKAGLIKSGDVTISVPTTDLRVEGKPL